MPKPKPKPKGTVEFKCPHCQLALRITVLDRGQNTKDPVIVFESCPACGGELQINTPLDER